MTAWDHCVITLTAVTYSACFRHHLSHELIDFTEHFRGVLAEIAINFQKYFQVTGKFSGFLTHLLREVEEA